MMQAAPRTCPPRFAAWLVDLFACSDQAELILGDLAEEFSDIASKSGVVSARHWYWRQTGKAIFHLSGAAFRGAPWSLTGVVILGFLLRWLSAALLTRVVLAILRMEQPYSNLHSELYAGLVTWGIPIARILAMTLIGCIVAATAKGREIVATLSLTAVSSVVFGLLFFLRVQAFPPQVPIPWIFLLSSLENSMVILLGGILMRKIRSAAVHQLSEP